MTTRRFPPPWQVEQTPGGFKAAGAGVEAETSRAVGNA